MKGGSVDDSNREGGTMVSRAEPKRAKKRRARRPPRRPRPAIGRFDQDLSRTLEHDPQLRGAVGWLLCIVASAVLWAMILGAVGSE